MATVNGAETTTAGTVVPADDVEVLEAEVPLVAGAVVEEVDSAVLEPEDVAGAEDVEDVAVDEDVAGADAVVVV